MISADKITFEGNKALVVMVGDPELIAEHQRLFDRPCDTCDGFCDSDDEALNWRCPDCLNGRHTFSIEVECTGVLVDNGRGGLTCNGGCQDPPYGVLTHRVSIESGMVLPIVADVGPRSDERHIRMTGAGVAWLAEPIGGGGWKHTEITISPAAKVGDWVIELNVQPKEQQ